MKQTKLGKLFEVYLNNAVIKDWTGVERFDSASFAGWNKTSVLSEHEVWLYTGGARVREYLHSTYILCLMTHVVLLNIFFFF
jgi:hypothetical protein